MEQPFDRFAALIFGEIAPSFFLHELLPNVVLGETKRRDRPPGILVRFPSQGFRRMREQAEEEVA
jgi:hypothetical protein